jgi:hypothetical protein
LFLYIFIQSVEREAISMRIGKNSDPHWYISLVSKVVLRRWDDRTFLSLSEQSELEATRMASPIELRMIQTSPPGQPIALKKALSPL